MSLGLVLGRFNAVTRAQAEWLGSLQSAPVDEWVCVITSADHSGTRRNPVDLASREAMVRPILKKLGKPFHVVGVTDTPLNDEGWVDHVVTRVRAAAGVMVSSENATLFSANRDVDALFAVRGYKVQRQDVQGLTPRELVQRIAEGKPWREQASAETVELYSRPAVAEKVKAIFGQALLTDDGELGHARDFKSYGAQMDASLKQKLDELVPWVKPGCIVDKGCGTGKLLVELSRLFPESALVGVDLSHEFLRLCDENTYASDDVQLVFGNVIERNVEPGRATTIVYSSVMHEVHSYTGYQREEIDRALTNAHEELQPGGHVLIRDGVSPKPATWRLKLLDGATNEVFERFAKEFKHGEGAAHERLGPMEVRLSSHLANEFICKKDYLKNWHIEVHEEFGPLTLEGWGQALARTGFEVVHLQETVNPWIVQNRYQGKVALCDDEGRSLPWPATNCVVVGRRAG